MTDTVKLLQDLRRRRVFRLAGLYIVGAWIVIEFASVFFPAWGIPDTALRYLFIAAALLFPVALVFAWIFDITSEGIVRTSKAGPEVSDDLTLTRTDYGILAALAAVAVMVVLGSLQQVADETLEQPVEEAAARIENSIAVLPFANLDPNPETGYFSDGVTEEILHRLSSTRALHVLGRNSSFALRDSSHGPAQVSKLLGVAFLLDGSIRRDGNFVRVTARLLDQSGLQVWSQSFDRELKGIFAIQSEIAGTVASRIVDEIISTDGRTERRSTNNLEAYDEYLLGMTIAHARTDNWHERSETAFRNALALDPEFAPAYAGLVYSLVVMRGFDEARWNDALDAAKRSLELDPDLAEGHAILGLLESNLGMGDARSGEQHLRRALELNPSLSDAYNWLALLLGMQRRFDESERLMAQGFVIDPLFPTITVNHAAGLSNRGELGRARRAIERLEQLPEPPRMALGVLSGILYEWGRYAEVIGLGPGPLPYKAISYELLGVRDASDQERESLKAMDLARYFTVSRLTLHARGKHADAVKLNESMNAEFGVGYEELSFDDLSPAIIDLALSGDHEKATELFESLANGRPAVLVENVFATEGQDVLNALAYAYRETGNNLRADEILNYKDLSIARMEPLRSPHFLEPMALNAALRGDNDEAYELLSRAVDLGWANYYMAINDPRWGDALSQPRFRQLLERVKDNIAHQKAEVESMLAERE